MQRRIGDDPLVVPLLDEVVYKSSLQLLKEKKKECPLNLRYHNLQPNLSQANENLSLSPFILFRRKP